MSNDAISPASKKLDKWVVDIEGQLQNCSDSSDDSEKYPSIIGKWQSWDDFGASFIPKTKKWQFVACMTHWFGLNVRLYLEYMQEKVHLAWSYYRGVDEQFCAENNERFIEHLLVNSCFLIFAMVLLPDENHLLDILNEMIDQNGLPKGLTLKDVQNIVSFTREDPTRTRSYMLNLNYQIPWFVLEVVYTELSNLSKLFVTPIHKFAVSCFYNLSPDMHPSKEDGGVLPEGGFKHLLHIFHWSRTLDGKYIIDRSIVATIGNFHIPSATELQLSQTVFEKVEGDSIDMSYSDKRRLSRVLQLTPWHLFHNNTKHYESLIRFEKYCGNNCGLPFTAYVACMSCLLKTEADVRVLRANGIIPSTSVDDKNVLRYVQELRALIADNVRMPSELINLEEKVMAHHRKSVYRVIGEFKKRYCSNTWIIISVVAGICLFLLTFIQTVLSFIQTKYSVLSYKKQ